MPILVSLSVLESSSLGLIGQNVCLGGTPVLVQPEGIRVLVVELLPDYPVAPLRAPVVALG